MSQSYLNQLKDSMCVHACLYTDSVYIWGVHTTVINWNSKKKTQWTILQKKEVNREELHKCNVLQKVFSHYSLSADSFSLNGKISSDITTQHQCGITAKCYFTSNLLLYNELILEYSNIYIGISAYWFGSSVNTNAFLASGDTMLQQRNI